MGDLCAVRAVSRVNPSSRGVEPAGLADEALDQPEWQVPPWPPIQQASSAVHTEERDLHRSGALQRHDLPRRTAAPGGTSAIRTGARATATPTDARAETRRHGVRVK